MQAMVCTSPRSPLEWRQCPIPEPSDNQILIKVEACGVCRTDLHIVEGELKVPHFPLIPGHQIVGRVVKLGKNCRRAHLDDRVGVPWLGFTCQQCRFCLRGEENLCESAQFTGLDLNGGFAEYCVANEAYCHPLDPEADAFHLAPLLCAGLIGYRAYRQVQTAANLGLYGFGSSAHILTQVAVAEGKRVFAFTRRGDNDSQNFAQSLGAVWAGSSDQMPPELLEAAILFAPEGALIPQALQASERGASIVAAGIHMSDIPSFPYRLLWEERKIQSIANLTREDGTLFFALTKKIPIQTHIQVYPLQEANRALQDLKQGRINGSVVLSV